MGKIVIENAGNDGKCFDTNNNGKFFFFTYGPWGGLLCYKGLIGVIKQLYQLSDQIVISAQLSDQIELQFLFQMV